MENLKPCPFCGGEADYYENYYHGCNIYCQKCGAEFECDSEAEAIEAWNRRAEPPEEDE